MSSVDKYISKKIGVTIITFAFLIVALIVSYYVFNNNHSYKVTYISGGEEVNVLNYIEEDLNVIPHNKIILKNNKNKKNKIILKVIEDNKKENVLSKDKFIYMLNDIKKEISPDGVIDTITLNAKEQRNIDIRIWIDKGKIDNKDNGKIASLLFYIESYK